MLLGTNPLSSPIEYNLYLGTRYGVWSSPTVFGWYSFYFIRIDFKVDGSAPWKVYAYRSKPPYTGDDQIHGMSFVDGETNIMTLLHH